MLIRYIVVLMIMVLLGSCSESFKQLPVEDFNENLCARTDIKSADSLATAYLNYKGYYKEDEEKPRLDIRPKQLGNDEYEITMVDDIVDDDEVDAEKFIIVASYKEGSWKVSDIRYNMKYNEGYGHTNWGS